ncbi:MAG: S41 family peptidase [Bacteroidales bacterium]|nr:S41 family peptidase [Bacteroidales bacterium]HOY38482.1 S41 family peptidase [Bacteroidales bacterium]HQP05012.1 S41 family peptidase [Bacteroidales bacterium]
MKFKKVRFNKFSFLSLFFLLGSLMLLPAEVRAQEDKDFETVKQLDIFYSLYKELDLFYVDEIDPAKTIRIAIDAMLEKMDPYTVYLPEDEIEDLRFMTTGEYGGIGALIRKYEDYVAISEPYQGFPAQKSGLKAGDIIVAIDGKDTKGKNTSDVSELLKGQPGTNVKLSIRRTGENAAMEITITREEIKIPSVPYYELLKGDIAYIQLSSFTNTATTEVRDAYLELSQNRKLNGVILDLRGNPGGLLVEAVKICNLFLEKDVLVVSTKGKVEQWDKEYKTTELPLDATIPLVVLVNSGSASASEIVSGCMQDLDRGVIIGQKTYGKGLVQTTRDLSYNSKLKVTTAKYYIPSGRCIQALDYTHRNEDGSVGRVPDSLVSEFKTRNGRSVFDGGGVLPDIVTEPRKIASITESLILENFIFDFATDYTAKNNTIAGAAEFHIDDALYGDFVSYLSDKHFEYQTESEELLNELIETSKEEKYFSVAEAELEALRLKLGHDTNKDLLVFKDEISEILGMEIVHRYYYQKGKIQYEMKYDEELNKAIEVISNKAMYDSILGVKNK